MAIREPGANGLVIASYAYDPLGRRKRLDRGNGTASVYAYDAAGRLETLFLDFPNDAYDQTLGLSYSRSSDRPDPWTKIDGRCIRPVMKASSYLIYGFEGKGGRYMVLETYSAREARDLRDARIVSGFPTVVFGSEGELTARELDQLADLEDRFG